MVKDGNNLALALPAAPGGNPAALVVVNELTTVAPVVTTAWFLDGTALKGNRLALPIVMASVFCLSGYLPCPDF